MFNAKLLIGWGAGIAGAWKFWPENLGVHSVVVVLGALLLVWVLLVATICVLDHRRRQVPWRPRSNPKDAVDTKAAAMRERWNPHFSRD